MLVVIEIETKEILRIITDNEEYNIIDFYNRGKIIADIPDPVKCLEFKNGKNKLIFREILSDEFKTSTYFVFKEIISILIKNIEVSYKGILYQGDETSQDRISRAINGLPNDVTTISWKAKDNSSQELTRLDLKEILFLAIQEQTRILFT